MNESDAQQIVEQYMTSERPCPSTQELLDSGAIPFLRDYRVRPGKVSDSVFGGEGSFFDKTKGEQVEFENPPLVDKNGNPIRMMVRTDRISTHDINRGSIPFKDQILAENHHHMRELVRGVLGTSQYDVPGLDSNSVVIAAENLQQIALEMVLRAYAAKSTTVTSLYQAYFVRGERVFCGHELPEGLIPNGVLPYVMDTPSTKSDTHDESVAPEKLFQLHVCTPQQYQQIRNGSLVAFGVASHYLAQKGIILADTKTEHGVNHKGEIVSQDELYTMDSSRFWLAHDYTEQLQRLAAGEIQELAPKSYSKEFARGFSEEEKEYTDKQRATIAVRYILGAQHLLGKDFAPDTRSREERVVTGLQTIVEHLGINVHAL